MLVELVPLLRCPWCDESSLHAQPAESEDGGRRIVTGTLRCGACGAAGSIEDGIWDAMGDRRMHRTLAQVSNILSPTARFYEQAWRRRSLSLLSRRPFPIDEELRELHAALVPGEGTIALDIACSEGLYARSLADAGATVLAVDHSLPFLRRVVGHERARRARTDRGAVVAVRALAQHLPVAAGAIDAAAIGGSLNEIGDAPTALAEVHRSLRHDGRAFSMHLVRATRPIGRLVQALVVPSGIAFRSAEETAALFRGAGLVVDTVHADGVVQRVTAHRP